MSTARASAFLRRLLLLPTALLAISAHAILDERADTDTDTADTDTDTATADTIPAPISFAPDQNWDGIDGEWSSFTLRVGTPEQFVRTFVSFASYQTWVVHTAGCGAAASVSACEEARGWVFDQTDSSTFNEKGIYDLWIQQNLGLHSNGVYGFDTVGLGGAGEGGPTVQNTTVGIMALETFYLGVFGINPKPTNWTDFNDQSPSYMTLLKEQKHIPSLSFGYTAGAKYRFSGVLASLTLGGYDASKFIENNVTFTFGSDNERDILVAIQSITIPSRIESSPIATQLLPSPIYAYIDSTVPEIWLPKEACEAFEIEFGLVYDNTTNLYLVNEALHDDLLERNANVTFTLGQAFTGGSTAQIVLPYAAFDLTAKPPYKGLANNTRYFPLQRAQNDTQHTLGRTFLQEAYVAVDWESARFNVSQVLWDPTPEQRLVPILPSSTVTRTNTNGGDESNNGLSTGAIAGVAIGAVAAIALLGVLLIFYFRRKRQAADAKQREDEKLEQDSDSTAVASSARRTSGYQKAELPGSTAFESEYKGLLSAHDSLPGTPHSMNAPSSPGYHMSVAGVSTPTSAGVGTFSSSISGALLSPLTSTASEADGRERQIYEMPGDMPAIREKDGKALSEKEALAHRERIYNGVDATTPTSTESPRDFTREPRRINPEEVINTGQSAEVRDETLHRRFSFEEGVSTQDYTSSRSSQ